MIFLTGDIHGDKERFNLIAKSGITKKDVLIICGDFGFVWDGSKAEHKLLKWIGKRKYQIFFVDGCNENHKLLNEYPDVTIFGGKAKKISGNLYMFNRGEIFEIHGKKVFAFGGGDNTLATQEQMLHGLNLPTPHEMQNASENLKLHKDSVDIVVTHDVPTRIKTIINLEDNELSHLHTFLEDICATVNFNTWFFGKYHSNRLIPPCYKMLFDDVIRFE